MGTIPGDTEPAGVMTIQLEAPRPWELYIDVACNKKEPDQRGVVRTLVLEAVEMAPVPLLHPKWHDYKGTRTACLTTIRRGRHGTPILGKHWLCTARDDD